MRTKVLLCAAALAAGAISSMAQTPVYSLNVVGYVNVTIPGNGFFTIVNNPLDNGTNDVVSIFPSSSMSDGCTIQVWDPNIADWSTTFSTYSGFLKKWDTNFGVPVGSSVFFNNPNNDITNTFTGNVLQGTISRSIRGNGNINLIGNSVPVGGSFTNALVGLAVSDGDVVQTWNNDIQDWDPTFATYSGFLKKWDNTAINVNVGYGFSYTYNGNDPTTWVRNFTVQ